MKPRPLIVVWLFALTALAFLVVGLVANLGGRRDAGGTDFAIGTILLVIAALVSRIYCKR